MSTAAVVGKNEKLFKYDLLFKNVNKQDGGAIFVGKYCKNMYFSSIEVYFAESGRVLDILDSIQNIYKIVNPGWRFIKT